MCLLLTRFGETESAEVEAGTVQDGEAGDVAAAKEAEISQLAATVAQLAAMQRELAEGQQRLLRGKPPTSCCTNADIRLQDNRPLSTHKRTHARTHTPTHTHVRTPKVRRDVRDMKAGKQEK
jgi:hypothetical protein